MDDGEIKAFAKEFADEKFKMLAVIVLGILAGLCSIACIIIAEQRGELIDLRGMKKALATCQEELSASRERIERYEAEKEKRRKVEDQARRDAETRRDGEAEKAKRFVKELPCRLDMINWQGRVEGDANLPPGSVKTAVEWEKGNGPDPGFTMAQKKRLARALRENPLPECTEEERASP
jgi:hypothetical protein